MLFSQVRAVDCGVLDQPAVTSGGPSAVVQKSGRQILLAAATAAVNTPEESGTYWYVKTVSTSSMAGRELGESSVETWTRRDGKSWFRASGKNEVTENGGKNGHWSDGFDLENTRLSYEQIQRLATDPDELVTWLVRHAGKPLHVETARVVPLLKVLSSMPAPPEVRAAAFRALAAQPNVRNLGAVDGGESLAIDYPFGELRLVTDVEAARLRTSVFTSAAAKPGKDGTTLVEKAEWTDDLPKAIR
ncbi:hypothetical protein [Sinosporangium siamense]|uniref:Uncharacterized protein n=1 Tax=Sinosporangium siamense TaxID=1367973 RepID=A0A919VC15_9ACTN|nr:hypothetical protein [Sinosporangium siamense]GII97127.1 hypothetical protein Ssi02_73580 [Sinosporangium siamense]